MGVGVTHRAPIERVPSNLSLQVGTGLDRPVAYLLLGSDSLELVRGKLNNTQADLDR